MSGGSFPRLGKGFSEEEMKEVIQPPAEEHFAAGIAHDQPNRGPIAGVVAVSRAVLAGGFGVHGAMGALNEGMGQELRALRAERNLVSGNPREIVGAQVGGDSGLAGMFMSAIEFDEKCQRFEIAAEFDFIEWRGGRSGHIGGNKAFCMPVVNLARRLH